MKILRHLVPLSAVAIAWAACADGDTTDATSTSTTSASSSVSSVSSSGSGGGFAASSSSSSASSSNSASSSGSGGAGGASTSSSGGGGGGGVDCVALCSTVFECGKENSACNWTDGDETLFNNGSVAVGCLDQCAAQPQLAALVNGNNCPATITALEGASDDFDCVCTHGVSGSALLDCLGGAGGAGGTGGAGGAGGAGGGN